MSKTAAHHYRVFFALNFATAFCQQLDAWRRHIPLRDGRWVSMSQWHLTLSFLGDVDDRTLEQLLEHRFERLPPFELMFGELGYFSKAQVLFVQPTAVPDTLLQLQRACVQLKNRLRVGKNEATYTPHITLARDAIAPIPAASQTLQLSSRHHEFFLMQSLNTRDGVQYRELQRWPLQKALRPQPR